MIHMYLPLSNKVDVPWQNMHLLQLALVVLVHTQEVGSPCYAEDIKLEEATQKHV